MTTAEWKCTKCGVTNRKLVPNPTDVVRDKCVTCGAKHEVRPGQRPAFWEATVQA